MKSIGHITLPCVTMGVENRCSLCNLQRVLKMSAEKRAFRKNKKNLILDECAQRKTNRCKLYNYNGYFILPLIYFKVYKNFPDPK